MSGDFETLEINQPKITYLKPEDNTEGCLLYTSPSPRD